MFKTMYHNIYLVCVYTDPAVAETVQGDGGTSASVLSYGVDRTPLHFLTVNIYERGEARTFKRKSYLITSVTLVALCRNCIYST